MAVRDALSPTSPNRGSAGIDAASTLLFALVLILAFAFSLSPRIEQYRALAEEGRVASGERIPSAGGDSYYWFRLAREYRDGDRNEPIDSLRHFPDGTPYESLPAISWMIAKATDLVGTNVYHAGLLLSVLLSSLFVLPMALYGWQAGYPAAGIFGALVGSFSAAFYRRTYVYKVDTDGGNLFFVWLIALLMASLKPDQSDRRRFFLAGASGLAVNGFCWWYALPGFWPIYFGVFTLIVLSLRGSWRQSVGLVALYALCSNPLYLVAGFAGLQAFVGDYLMASANGGSGTEFARGLVFPDVTNEIDELVRYEFWRALRGTLSQPILASIGLLGFAVFIGAKPRRLLPLLPMLALATLGFVWASRMMMYAAPLVGFGIGYVLSVVVSAGQRAWMNRRRPEPATSKAGRGEALARDALAYVAAGALLFGALGYTSYSKRPAPSFDPRLIEDLRSIADILPPDSAILTTWPYGYLVTDITGAATFDDARDPNDVVQQLIARGITSHDPRELADIAHYLSRAGRSGAAALAQSSESYSALLEGISEDANEGTGQHPPIHVLFTERMLRADFSSYFYRGHWNFETGTGPKDGYGVLRCRTLDAATRLKCRAPNNNNLEVDLESGMLGGRPVLRRSLRTRDGGVVWEKTFDGPRPLSFETIEIEGADLVIGLMMQDAVYASNFNQMFVLGRADPSLFRESYRDFPVLRSFEIIPRPQD